jgi:hypothetical protein
MEGLSEKLLGRALVEMDSLSYNQNLKMKLDRFADALVWSIERGTFNTNWWNLLIDLCVSKEDIDISLLMPMEEMGDESAVVVLPKGTEV